MEAFPPSTASQTYVTAHALSSGFLTLPEELFVHPCTPGARNTVPSLSFLIQHHSPSSTTTKPTRILFDLGIRKDFNAYPSLLQERMQNRKLPVITEPDVSDSLKEGGLEQEDVDFVVLSHVHWDHVGTPSDFKRSMFVVGNGSLGLLKKGASEEGGEFYEPDLLPPERTIELPGVNCEGEMEGKVAVGVKSRGSSGGVVELSGFPQDLTTAMIEEYFSNSIGPIKDLELVPEEKGVRRGVAIISFKNPKDAQRAVDTLNGVNVDGKPLKLELVAETSPQNGELLSDVKWEKFGPLPNVIDIFSDGSVYLVDSPGHLDGHLNLLARLGPNKWLYLAGDACHDRRIMRGELEIATWKNPHGEECCIHSDKEATEKTIKLIVGLEKMDGVEVVLAHDTKWLNEKGNKMRFWPGKM
jgi:glyoxylase-like metal-dependent hydrolase (beta-lactamase superfamily II)